MPPIRVVLDTNVIFAAAKSGQGASALLLRLAFDGEIECLVSELLWSEYCGVLRRSAAILERSEAEIEGFLAVVAQVMTVQEVFFEWRPLLRDAADDKVLECAVAAGVPFLVTFNTRDFAGIEQFTPRLTTPSELLHWMGNQKQQDQTSQEQMLQDQKKENQS